MSRRCSGHCSRLVGLVNRDTVEDHPPDGGEAVSIADVFEEMTAREAAKIVIDDKLDVDVDRLADCIKQVSRKRSARVVSSTRKRGVRETLKQKAIESTILEAAREAVDSAVQLSKNGERSFMERLGLA